MARAVKYTQQEMAEIIEQVCSHIKGGCNLTEALKREKMSANYSNTKWNDARMHPDFFKIKETLEQFPPPVKPKKVGIRRHAWESF